VTARQLADKSSDPGVPEALPRTLIRLRDRLGVEEIERLWIFPPVRNGRRERGLITVSTYQRGEDRRSMITVAYVAEHTGKGVTVEPSFTMEGAATPDRFPRVMQGVVRRGGVEKGEPQEVEIDGSPQRFEALLEEYDEQFLEVNGP
jgi:hypothetical protein